MSILSGLTANRSRVLAHRPWPRVEIDGASWEDAARRLAAGELTLLGLWGDGSDVHMALHEVASGEFAVATLSCPDARYPSIGKWHAPAVRLERAVRDLSGLEPVGAPDRRAWLDHGRWGMAHPLGPATQTEIAPTPYAFLPVEGESLHQIPVGPVHAGIIEPGHFRFTASGETVVRLEQRLGYVHKGVETLLRGADVPHAARIAGRTSGDSTVAYAFAFARAVEAALGIEVPARGQWLRALMAELERLANHLGDIGAICNDATFTLMHAQCGILRERVLRAAEACFGHRLMMDQIVPGGVVSDISGEGQAVLRGLRAEIEHRLPALIELYDNTASLQDRTMGTGTLDPDLAVRFGAGGYVGRASGRGFDARRQPGYPPYDMLDFEVPVERAGDVNARVWVRIREIEQSLLLIGQLVGRLPDGPTATEPVVARAGACEGVALTEGFRGDILAWVRLDAGGKVARCHLRDPSWFQWPLLEAVIDGNIVADFPLCNKSFNCSYSGHDL
jgi:Ni,Fe-hydrogenase III large subunit